MADAGWFTDPSGRFGQRYWDGASWTTYAVGANGSVLEDELPHRDVPYPPPTAPAPVPPPTQQAPIQHAPAQQAPVRLGVRYGVGAGLIIGLVGIVVVLLGLFVLTWGGSHGVRFTKLSGAARKTDLPSSASAGQHAAFAYLGWLAFVLFAVVVVLVVLAGIPVPRTGPGNRFWRIGASLLAAAGTVLQAMTMSYLYSNNGSGPGLGPVLTLGGWLVVIIGMIFGARRIVRPVAPFA